MTKVSIKNLKGETVKDVTLADSIFKADVNELAIKKAVRLQLDSLRQGTAKTKNRSEVSGGGRKPWKQKGTGRARQGSNRAPHWVGGGVVFGKQNRDYSFKINKKERRLALISALSDKVANKSLIVVDSLVLSSLKTKDAKELFKTLNLKGKVLFVASEDCEKLYMATRNMKNTLVLFYDEINVYDIIDSDMLVIDEESLKQIEEVLK